VGGRALLVYEGNKDTLYRTHGTNQPEYIGQAISSGCNRASAPPSRIAGTTCG
jgi:lipoprotein-anchoring transpeptidase ErfK/SrfK